MAVAGPPSPRERRLLFGSYHCYVDPSSGAAMAARDLLPLLTARGWRCRVLSGPQLDFEDGRPFRQLVKDARTRLGMDADAKERPCLGAAIPCSTFDLVQGEIPITVFEAPGSFPFQPPRREEGYLFLAYFEQVLEQFRPDLFLTYGGHWLAQEINEAARRHGIPVVFWLHNCSYRSADYFKAMQGVIVPSRFTQAHYRQTLGLEFTPLPPTLDWSRVVCPEVKGEYITFVNPQPDKGVFVFAAIVQELHRRRPDIPFLVVEGRGKLSWLREAGLDLDRLGNVFGLATTPDPRSFYSVSRLVLVPSVCPDSFPRVAAEALANGIPVLASRRGGLPEALEQAGFLFDVPERYNPQSRAVPSAEEVTPWVETILRLWDDPDFYEGERRRALKAAEAWKPDRIAAQYDEYFSSVLARRSALPAGTAPVVSVIMPVHNGASFLERSFRSLQAQTLPAWECLVVDDGSTDESYEIACRFSALDPRIRPLRLPVNSGLCAARNTGLRQARAGIIAYLDCDDEYYPDFLARVQVLSSRAEVLIFCYDQIEERTGAPDIGKTQTYDPRPYQRLLFAKQKNIVVPLGLTHQLALLNRSGYFNETIYYDEDWDLWQRFVDAGASFLFAGHKSGLYHVRSDSLARTHRLPDAVAGEKKVRGNPGELISCLTLTYDRYEHFLKCLECYDAQTYSPKELVVVCNGSEEYRRKLMNVLNNRSDVTFVQLTEKLSLGDKRNIAVKAARGQYICQWDDDDLCHPTRLEAQRRLMGKAPAHCFTQMLHFLEPTKQLYWLKWPVPIPGVLMAQRDLLLANPFPPLEKTEDEEVVNKLYHQGQLVSTDNPAWLYVYVYHGNNTWEETHHRNLIHGTALPFSPERKAELEQHWPSLAEYYCQECHT